jgi:hypothetical protein
MQSRNADGSGEELPGLVSGGETLRGAVPRQ